MIAAIGGAVLAMAAAAPICAQVPPAGSAAVPAPSSSQAASVTGSTPATAPVARVNQVAPSSVGRPGQRITRSQTAGLVPLGRFQARIQNRVQARLRNRIDRNYDPQANATAPFQRAEENIGRGDR